jgi:hypothetical protein
MVAKEQRLPCSFNSAVFNAFINPVESAAITAHRQATACVLPGLVFHALNY